MPAPLPTKIKLLHGERRAGRINKTEPKPSGSPTAPSDMSAAARAVWRRLWRDYGHTGVLTAVDRDVMRIYCEAVVRYEQNAKTLETAPVLLEGKYGPVRNPLSIVVKEDANLIRLMAHELGFTPAARSTLHTPQKGEGDALDRWASGEG